MSSTERPVTPLIIHGQDVTPSQHPEAPCFVPNQSLPGGRDTLALGATPELCVKAADSCASAFATWRNSSIQERRALFNKLAAVLRDRQDELMNLIQDELACTRTWASIGYNDTVDVVEQAAALVTSGVLSGVSPPTNNPLAHAVVFKEPLGVILGIAPWNSPLLLAFRAVVAAVATGNTAILKGSELSPRIHYAVADMFRVAGFPPGVVNFVVHQPEDAQGCFEALISHPAVRKCNFTGSTAVGRQVAARAAMHLKPVLLELGGKNCAVVLEDADLEKAAEKVLMGALLNTGQICMSTDVVLVARSVEPEFYSVLCKAAARHAQEATRLITDKSDERVQGLLQDAEDKGATLFRFSSAGETAVGSSGERPSGTIIRNLTRSMAFWKTEAFGPVLGIFAFDDASEVPGLVAESNYGLSAAIFTRDHMKALQLARALPSGAVHVNAPTAHDEAVLPHGGYRDSGWGRFGSHWGFEEFLQTKTVILNP